MPAPDPDAPAALPWRERAVLGALLVAVAGLGWVWTAHHAQMMRAMPVPGVPPAWSAGDAAVLFAMWTLMMAAMMVPSAAPMLTAFATINHRRRERGEPHVGSAAFLAGYVLAWSAFALVATALHQALQAAGLLDATAAATSPALSAALFALAGAYQFSPLKEACLAYCRSPHGFILGEWRDGTAGAVVMGLRHGLFCTGCCAALMLLLFAVAVMDLRWVAALSVIVTVEKLAPDPRRARRAIGVAALAAGAGYAVAALAR